MTNQQPAELTEPGIGSLHNPAPFVTPHFASIFIAPSLVVLPVGRNQLNCPPPQSLAQGIRVVASIRDYPRGLLPRPAFWAGDTDFRQRGFRKRNFRRRGTFQPNSQRKTLTVDQYHPLRALATLGFTDCGAPFLAGAKLPSRKASSHFSNPSPSSAPSSARQASSQTSCSSHCRSRRQQVAGDGYLSGRNRHAAPVHSTQRIPSRQARLDAHGRPRLSRRRFGSGNRGSIKNHCASVNSSNRRWLTSPVSQTSTRLKKYQA